MIRSTRQRARRLAGGTRGARDNDMILTRTKSGETPRRAAGDRVAGTGCPRRARGGEIPAEIIHPGRRGLDKHQLGPENR
jgi:hypothetical protein